MKTLTYETAHDGDGEFERLDVAHSKRSLLKASRSARIKAVQLIPKLLGEIKEAAESTIENIEKAEKAAEGL